MTVKPRSQAEDDRFVSRARFFADIDAFTMGDEYTLALFAIILVYIFARALWGLIRDLRDEHKPKKKQRVTTTPTHYPK